MLAPPKGALMFPEGLNYKQVYRGTGDNDRFVIDRRFYPIMMVDLRGMATDALMRVFYADVGKWLDHIRAKESQPLVGIIGLDRAKVAPPTTRKLAADFERKYMADPNYLHAIYVVNSRVIRGAMTAVSWMSGADTTKISYVLSWKEGIMLAKSSYAAAGWPMIEIPLDYQFPTNWISRSAAACARECGSLRSSYAPARRVASQSLTICVHWAQNSGL